MRLMIRARAATLFAVIVLASGSLVFPWSLRAQPSTDFEETIGAVLQQEIADLSASRQAPVRAFVTSEVLGISNKRLAQSKGAKSWTTDSTSPFAFRLSKVVEGSATKLVTIKRSERTQRDAKTTRLVETEIVYRFALIDGVWKIRGRILHSVSH